MRMTLQSLKTIEKVVGKRAITDFQIDKFKVASEAIT